MATGASWAWQSVVWRFVRLSVNNYKPRYYRSLGRQNALLLCRIELFLARCMRVGTTKCRLHKLEVAHIVEQRRECQSVQIVIEYGTSISETIRKPLLVKAQTALKNKKNNNNKIWRKRFSIWRMEFVHPAMWHDHDIDFVRWLHHAMWHVALGTWQWINQVAAPCNVNRGSGMTCHWIRPNVCHIGILHLGSISTISLQSTCHSAPVCEILSRLDHPRQKKMTSCRFSRWRISAIFDFRGVHGCYEAHVRLPISRQETVDSLVFFKIAFSHFGVKIQDGGSSTDEQLDSIDALSRSRCGLIKVNKVVSLEVITRKLCSESANLRQGV